MAPLEQKLGSDQDQWLVVYLLLALCLCTVIFSLLVGWTHFKRRGAEVSCQPTPGTCHKREDSSKGKYQLLEKRGYGIKSQRGRS